MKKTILIISFGITILIAILFNYSCTKLIDESYSVIDANKYVYSENDILVIVNSAYGDWRKILLFWNGLWRTQELGADEQIIPARPNGWVDAGEFKRMHLHTWNATDPQVINNWRRTYEGIENCNRVIDDIKADEYPMEEDAKISALAQLKVLRASYYYILCDIYGNVPIVEHSADYLPEGYLPEQNTRKELYDFIVKEIKDNLPYLSRKNDISTYGKWNIWAARTLLAKIYLNAEVYTGTPAWEACMEQCDSVIANNVGIDLENDQKAVFETENENSIEIIYGISIKPEFLDNMGIDWNAFDIHMQTLEPVQQATYDLNVTPWGGPCAIPQFIDSFDPDDSRLSRNFIIGQQFASDGTPLLAGMGDYADSLLIYVNYVPNIDYSEAVHGYRFQKFEIALGAINILANDYPLLRYGDILMMKAECLLRTGDADGAAEIVTQVRTRAFTSNPDKATVTGAQLMEKTSAYNYGFKETRDGVSTVEDQDIEFEYARFLDELGWEFNQEGRRRQDMIRFGIYHLVDYLSHDHSVSGEYRTILPIPDEELTKNPNLKQNSGY
ncbi:RagB/SusD family nutrient uptake outer membrane protein [Bacteroidota bacterium]